MFYKITQLRSTIGMPPVVRKNMEALGLTKRYQIKYQKVSPSTAHRLIKVKELVKVELVDEAKTPAQVAQERKFPKGFQIQKGEAVNKYE
ncbi:39S ribosomal protein L33, mitochondrial [Yamadazyma tenuis]|nr:39S ribosomal protein L33, mitochondrial [Yamadazyma tenuis]